MTRLTFLAVLAAGLALAARPGSAQQKLPTAAEVLAKLKEKRDRGGVQKYKLEFEVSFFRNGQQTATGREVWELQIDWATGKFRKAGWKGWGGTPFELIKAYDGEKIENQFRDVTKDGKPVGDGAWKYGMLTGPPNTWVFPGEYWPVFFHNGSVAGIRDQFYPTHLAFDPDGEKFYVDREVVRGGRKCLSLMTFPENPAGPMQFEYVIDPSKDYAVVGLLYTQSGNPTYSFDIDVGQTRQGRWALRGWTRTVYDGRGGADQVWKVKVTDYDDNVPVGADNQFDIVPPEGAKVGRSHYQWPEGSDLTRTEYWYQVKNGKLVQIAGPKPPLWDRIRDNWHWLALGAGFVAAAFVGFRGRRGWRRGPHAPPAPPADGG